jgi:predicted DNA-binding transcriptional regulator AlpA
MAKSIQGLTLGQIEALPEWLTLTQVKTLACLSITAIYRKMNEGSFPSNFKSGECMSHRSRWSKSEVMAWRDLCSANANVEQITKLVQSQIKERQKRIESILLKAAD